MHPHGQPLDDDGVATVGAQVCSRAWWLGDGSSRGQAGGRLEQWATGVVGRKARRGDDSTTAALRTAEEMLRRASAVGLQVQRGAVGAHARSRGAERRMGVATVRPNAARRSWAAMAQLLLLMEQRVRAAEERSEARTIATRRPLGRQKATTVRQQQGRERAEVVELSS